MRVANAMELKALVLLSEIERALVAGVHKPSIGRPPKWVPRHRGPPDLKELSDTTNVAVSAPRALRHYECSSLSAMGSQTLQT